MPSKYSKRRKKSEKTMNKETQNNEEIDDFTKDWIKVAEATFSLKDLGIKEEVLLENIRKHIEQLEHIIVCNECFGKVNFFPHDYVIEHLRDNNVPIPPRITAEPHYWFQCANSTNLFAIRSERLDSFIQEIPITQSTQISLINEQLRVVQA